MNTIRLTPELNTESHWLRNSNQRLDRNLIKIGGALKPCINLSWQTTSQLKAAIALQASFFGFSRKYRNISVEANFPTFK